jgi:hypothetical protein
MRKTCLAIVLAVLVLVPATSFAQETLLEVLRSDVRAEKVAMITEMMMFTDEQAEVFWPIYRDMDHEAGKLTDQRIALIKEYAENYDSMTDKVAKDIVGRSFTLREKRLALEKKYYRKISNALDPITAAKFFQLNREINLMIDLQISSGLPFFQ